MAITLLLLLLFVALVFFGIAGLSWFISSKLLNRTGNNPSPTILVTDITAQTITLQRTKNTSRPGVFGITGAGGQAIIGLILNEKRETVERELVSVRGVLPRKAKVAWNTTVYGNLFRDSLSLNMYDVAIQSELGAMPAWYVPGKRDTWAILVHGATGTREQTLRASKTLAEYGLHLLAMTYRNDKGAPASGLSHLGDTEWQDLEAGVRYALEHGAHDVILYGWSLGGTIVEIFLNQSVLANCIRAVILDSPVLSWRTTVNALIKKNSLPSFLAYTTEKVVALRTGVRFQILDQMCQESKHEPLPYLLFHGTADSTAPLAISEMFAADHPQVTCHRVDGAEHTQSWNANPAYYEKELRSFLMRML